LPEDQWPYYESIGMVRELMEQRMYPLTLGGLEAGMRALSR
ncbi:MAG: VWA domain-containing protein, partial [Betaproteobacteria bacterium]